VSEPAIDGLPGYRRRFIVTPGLGWVRSALEDDFHCMAVLIRHDGEVATAIEPQMERAPWTTCPGAVEQLKQSFTGVRLDAFAERGDKQQNCTHLHDLALLAGTHALDSQQLVYDILVSDPVDGLIRTELRRNGTSVMGWTLEDMEIVEPAELAGQRLDALSPWIKMLDPVGQEQAKILRWGTMVAHGRTIPMEHQSDASQMPPNCFTFQPHRAAVAVRVGKIRDFSTGQAQPLERFAGCSDALPFAPDAA
jgi:hypothetical protein